MHLLTALCDPVLGLLHRALGSVTKDKGKKSNSKFEGLDSFTGGVYITLDLLLALHLSHASGINPILPDPSRSPLYTHTHMYVLYGELTTIHMYIYTCTHTYSYLP